MTYVNPGSILAVAILFPVLGALSVGARFYVRRWKKQGLGVDDWLAFAAQVFVWALGISLIVGVAGHAFGYNSGPKDNAGNNPTIVFLEKCEWAFNLASIIALGLVKLSILFFYRRIFQGKVFTILNWALIGFVIAWTIGFFFGELIGCPNQIYLYWGQFQQLVKCVNVFNMWIAFGVTDVIVDAFILVLPIPFIWRLHMPTRRKVAVSAIFLLGFFSFVAGVLRLVVFVQILGAGHTQAVLYILGIAIFDDIAVVSLFCFWPMVQIGVAAIVISLPMLRPLFGGMTAESVIRSVRSKISLASFTASRPRLSSREGKTSETGRTSKDSASVVHETKLDSSDHPEVPATYAFWEARNETGSETKRSQYD